MLKGLLVFPLLSSSRVLQPEKGLNKVDPPTMCCNSSKRQDDCISLTIYQVDPTHSKFFVALP